MIKTVSARLRFLTMALIATGCACVNAEAATTGCADDPTFRQLDFLLGHWDVYLDNKITAQVAFDKVVKGCALKELWVGSIDPSGAGPSEWFGVFAFLRDEKAWQYFVVVDDGSAHTVDLKIKSPGNFCLAEKHSRRPAGAQQYHWCTISQPDGSIDDVTLSSSDGKEWKTEQTLTFRKKSEK